MSKYTLPDDLYSYQKEDLDRLLNSSSNFTNLSEMGVGKTPIAIGLSTIGNFRKILVACPKSLRLEWHRQITEWTNIDPAVSRRGSTRRLEPLFYDMLGKTGFNPFFIVNYETFRTRRHLDILNDYPFDLIILDEGHRLRNPRSKQTKGMFEFLGNHKDSKLLIMTGSPIVNNPADLHTLLRMVKPETYNEMTRNEFIDKFCWTSEKIMLRCRTCRRRIWRDRNTPVCPYCGSPNLREIVIRKPTGFRNLGELRQQTAPFTIRRTKKECLPWLPEKYYRRVVLDMSKKQRELYKQMEDELFVLLDSGEPLWAPSVLAQLTRLRQLNLEPSILQVDSPSSKTEFLMDVLDSMSGQKLVIFSAFEKYAQFLHYHPDIPKHIMIVGGTPVDERMELVRQFQEDDSIKVAIGTLQVMGEGITLTAASNVVFTDRWWTPSTNQQAEDRLHRIGAKSAVQVILPVNERSIDDSLDKILERKKKFSQDYMEDQDIMKEVVDDLRASRSGYEPPEDEGEEDENGDENGD